MQYYACNVRRGERGEGGVERGWKVVEFVCVCGLFQPLSLSSVSRGRDEQERKKGSGGSGACDSVARSGGSVVLVVAR